MRPRESGEEGKIEREQFRKRYLQMFYDPWFDDHKEKVAELEEIAWNAYQKGRKAPRTRKAGAEFEDPDYDLSLEWYEARNNIRRAQKLHDDPNSPPRILLISSSDRNDHTCPGEVSKTYRLTKLAEKILIAEGVEVEILDLSKLTSEFEKVIYPCKGCVSTAMPLCHWPCSCYPNHSLNQVNDWMNDIYPMWVRAHGIMIITPVYWHQAPSALKLMIDRLVCADGGNPDPTSTHGKDASKAKDIEVKGWNYPRHLEGRIFSLIIHGDTQGVDDLKNSLTSWLSEMMLMPSGAHGQISRYIGYYGTYAESHNELDKDKAIQEEVENAAKVLTMNITAARQKKLATLNPHMHDPRPK